MKIANTFTRPDGSPSQCVEVLKHAVERLAKASASGRSLRLSACEVRALDWAVIRDSTSENHEDRWLLSDRLEAQRTAA